MVATPKPERIIGRYALYDQIGAGGMATVHFGRLIGPAGFSKTVAIKRLHPHFARDPEFASMFLDEARLAARIHHPNVVSTLDVVSMEGELFLVMDFIEGLSLSGIFWEMIRAGAAIPVPIVGAIMTNILAGLHAAHEATNEQGIPLALIHRDVSPQNVLVGRDGVARVLDFGIAKAIGRSHQTREGRIKGKIAYMPPEQIRAQPLDRRVDVYAASVMLWELLTMRRLYDEEDDAATIYKSVHETAPLPSSIAGGLPPGTDELVMKGLSKDREQRYADAREMAIAVQRVLGNDSTIAVSDFVSRSGQDTLQKISSKVRQIESVSGELHTADVLSSSSHPSEHTSSRVAAQVAAAPMPAVPDLQIDAPRGGYAGSGQASAHPQRMLAQAPPAEPMTIEIPSTLPAAHLAQQQVHTQQQAYGQPPQQHRAPMTQQSSPPAFTAVSEPPGSGYPGFQPAAPPSFPPGQIATGIGGELDLGGSMPPMPPSQPGAVLGPSLVMSEPRAAPTTVSDAPGRRFAPADTHLGASKGLSVELDLPQPMRGAPQHPALMGTPASGMTARVPYGTPSRPTASERKLPVQALAGAGALLVLTAVGIGLYFHSAAKKTPASATAGLPGGLTQGGLERSCEVSRKRIATGGDAGAAYDTYGWVVEIWLAREEGAPLDAGADAFTSLRSPDGTLPASYGLKLAPEDRGEVSISQLPAPPWRTGTEPGVVIRLTGGYAGRFFGENTRGSFIGLADSTFEKSGATIGALYARCAHLAFHDVGAWFRGTDLNVAADALGFTMAGYQEAPWITRTVFEPHGAATTSFQAYQQHRMGVSSADFNDQLKLLGASVEETKKKATIIFPAVNLTRATSAARWLTQNSGM